MQVHFDAELLRSRLHSLDFAYEAAPIEEVIAMVHDLSAVGCPWMPLVAVGGRWWPLVAVGCR